MKKDLRRLNWNEKLHFLLVPFLFGAVGHSPGQSPDFWEIHMHEDDWIPSDSGWQLNAQEPGSYWITAHFEQHESQDVYIFLHPIHIMPWR